MTIKDKDVVQSVVGLTQVRLKTWVRDGLVVPTETDTGFVYTEIDVARCNLIRQLEDELEIDGEILPVILSLLDQIYGLRREMRVLTKAIEQQPESVRVQILELIRQNRTHD